VEIAVEAMEVVGITTDDDDMGTDRINGMAPSPTMIHSISI